MKKLSLFLALLLIATSVFCLFSCENGNGNSETTTKKVADTTTGEEVTTKKYLDDLPDSLHFNNEEISFIIGEPSNGNGGTFSERSIGLSDYTVGTNSVDDEIFSRNKNVEERLGVVITPVAVNDGIIRNTVYTDLKSGTSEYDVLAGYQARDTALALDGICLNFRTLKNYDADYIDVKAEYWSQSYYNALSYNKISYFMTGDLSLRYIGGMYCSFINTEVYADALEGTYGNLYDLVRSGDWTIETLIDMATIVFEDNGETFGKADNTGDLLGFVIEACDMVDGMALCAGINFTEMDPGGNAYLTLDESNEDALTFIDQMNQLLYKDGHSYVCDMKHSYNSMTLFANGDALCTCDKVYQAELYLGEMSNYGIVPCPKLYEGTTTSYRAAIHDGCSVYSIYSGSDSISATAATLEALAAHSYQTVTPAYYDMALKYRYTRDPDSAEMIDLIRANTYVDFGFAWGSNMDGIAQYFRDAVKTTSSVSTLKTLARKWGTALDQICIDLDEVASMTD